jgi:hypothetical protein
MDKWSEYRAIAADCRSKAATAPTEAERHEWLRLAKTWLRLIKPHARNRTNTPYCVAVARALLQSPHARKESGQAYDHEDHAHRNEERRAHGAQVVQAIYYRRIEGPGLCRFGDARCGQTPSWSGIAQSTDGHFLHIVLVSIQSTSGGPSWSNSSQPIASRCDSKPVCGGQRRPICASPPSLYLSFWLSSFAGT